MNVRSAAEVAADEAEVARLNALDERLAESPRVQAGSDAVDLY